MNILPLNTKALLYDGVKNATLESPVFTKRPKAPTPKEGENSDVIATTKFVSTVEDKLNSKIARIDNRLNDILSAIEDGNFGGNSNMTPYVYKGSCKYEDLPKENNVGDVYNVTDWHNDIPAGTNYAWTGDHWDALGGTIESLDDDQIEDKINEIFS